MIDVSVVIPCLNEAPTLEICIKKVIQSFAENKINGEVIVSDNGSSDESAEIAKNLGAIVVYCGEKGYGNALRYGISHANGKYIIIGDADNTYEFLHIANFYGVATSDESIDMVMGTRFKGKIEKGAMPFLHRYIGTPFLTFLINSLFGGNISDSQCGFRLFKKSSYDSIFFSTNGMEFATELIVEFLIKKYKIVEIPTSLSKNVEGRKPHLRSFRDGFRVLFYLLRKKFNII